MCFFTGTVVQWPLHELATATPKYIIYVVYNGYYAVLHEIPFFN